MPVAGELRKPQELGYIGHNKRMWCLCQSCGHGRWVTLLRGVPYNTICAECAKRKKGPMNGHWKTGRINAGGYTLVWVDKNDFCFPMTRQRNNYVLEHRLVMAKHLGRCLKSYEVVHHKNGVKNDNKIENLALLGKNSEHNKILNKEINRLQRENTDLRQLVVMLVAFSQVAGMRKNKVT